MKGTPLNTLPKESVDAIVRSTERIEGAASILSMLEEKADGGRVTPSEIAAVRCVLESCAAELDEAWMIIRMKNGRCSHECEHRPFH